MKVGKVDIKKNLYDILILILRILTRFFFVIAKLSLGTAVLTIFLILYKGDTDFPIITSMITLLIILEVVDRLYIRLNRKKRESFQKS